MSWLLMRSLSLEKSPGGSVVDVKHLLRHLGKPVHVMVDERLSVFPFLQLRFGLLQRFHTLSKLLLL